MKRILLAPIWLSLLLSCGESATPPPTPNTIVESPRTAAIAWMRQAAHPLATVEAGHGFADLAPLVPVLADARIVGLGEATHGTREFFQLKHRMFEFLVSELGFTVFGIEANFTEARAVDHYILTGEGDPARALAGLYFWTWNTEEVLALIHWMRAYNADPAHPRKLRFYGIDSQISMGPAQALLDYLAQVDPAYRAEVEPWLTRLLSMSELYGGSEQESVARASANVTPVQQLRARLEAQALQTHQIGRAPMETFEAMLTRLGLPLLALDLRAAGTEGVVARYLSQRMPMREIGAVYSPGYHYLYELRPSFAFDGVLFVETTTASRPNPPLNP